MTSIESFGTLKTGCTSVYFSGGSYIFEESQPSSSLFPENLLNFGVSCFFKAKIGIFPAFCPKTDRQPN
jgi:hypothetical protein